MNDWIGLLFFVLLAVGIFVGLKILSKKKPRTEAEFERGAAKSATLLGIGMNALQGILDPTEARAKEVQTQLKEGRYGKKKREGKASGNDSNEENYD
jgi:hypothetical protein